MIMKRLIVLTVIGLVFACDQQAQVSSSSTGQMPARNQDKAVLALGEKVYIQHCGKCHGNQGEGATDWRKTGPNGRYPPPPLNGSGHAWHHSRDVLRNVILEGSEPGQGDMPAWKGTLSEAETEAVITWFQSTWPDQVYAAWYEMQHR
jgi:mono/diheme cytochrome c family protein